MRTYLKKGTILELDSNDYYLITSDNPIGEGGGGILYSASRLHYAAESSSFVPDNSIDYAIKECFPVSDRFSFLRNANGEIIPETASEEGLQYLNISKQMQLKEKEISSQIYKKGFRITPVLSASASCRISSDQGKTFHTVHNTVSVMESLHEKGSSLNSILSEQKMIPCRQALSIIRQTLHALNEVHQAGYLYLDLQAGNIFVKGTLDGNNEFITLIDFGSARKMMEDQKSAPVTDRVLFSTEGYSAPEMLLQNDGTLRLDCRADLFSAGYLFLYMITGKKYTSREIIETRNGNYITGFRLKKLGCPRHLLPLLRTVLTRSLCTEPSGRYGSAAEMLDDIEQLIAALAPSKSSLYSVKYDAFICYKHGEVDSAAALQLQQSLEHLHIPRGVSPRHGRNLLKRVFVDEGELSSCADFGLQIREALKNSEYLIVICSPDTPGSPWVNLEIETFLEYHDRSHILSVLTGGEPEVSFPALLKKGKNNDEVFAADARGANIKECLKRLKKDALLRIAAPILGTSYDELKHRRQNYIFRRAAFASLFAILFLTGFLSFSLWQNGQIKKQYLESLKKQAQITSSEAVSAYEKGNLLQALDLVLSTVPDEGADEAIAPEQYYALNTIVAANNSKDYRPYMQIPNETFSQGSLSADRKLYVGLNQDNAAVFLDPITGKIKYRIRVSDFPYTTSPGWLHVYAVSEDKAILYGKHDVIAVNTETKEIIGRLSGDNISLPDDNSKPAVYDGTELKTAFQNNTSDVIIYNFTKNSIDASLTFHCSVYSDIFSMDFSDSGEDLFIGIRGKADSDYDGGLKHYSLKEKKLTSVSPDPVAFLECTNQNKLAVIQYSDDGMTYADISWLYSHINRYRMCIYDTKTFACCQEKEIGLFSYTTSGGFQSEVSLGDKKDSSFSAFIFWVGPVLLVYNMDAMEIYQEYAFPSYISCITAKNNQLLLIGLQNGSGRTLMIGKEKINNTYFLFELDANIEELYCFSDSSQLLVRASGNLLLLSHETDPAIQGLDDFDQTISQLIYTSDGKTNYRIIYTSANSSDYGFYVYEAGSDQLLFCFEHSPETKDRRQKISEPSIVKKDGKTILSFLFTVSDSFSNDNFLCQLCQIDLSSGDILQCIDLSSYGIYVDYFSTFYYDPVNARLYTCRKNGGMVYFDFSGSEIIPSEDAYLRDKTVTEILPTGDEKYLILECMNEQNNKCSIWLYDIKTQENIDTGLIYDVDMALLYNQFRIIPGTVSSLIAIYDQNHNIEIYDCQTRQILSKIDCSWCDDTYYDFAFFQQDQLLISVNPSTVILYDCASGKKVCSMEYDPVIESPLLFPAISISAYADSPFFSISSYGSSVSYDDGSLLPNPMHICRYVKEDQKIYPVCTTNYGFFDPNSLETVYYTGMH